MKVRVNVMKKLFSTILVVGLLSFNSVKAFPFVKLEEYLTTNSAEDPSITIYTFNRCAALSQFMSAISYERDKNLSEKYKNRQFTFLMSAISLHKKLFNVSEDKAMEDLTKVQRQMAELYKEVGNNSYIKTGSHLNSDLKSDLNICDYFGKN